MDWALEKVARASVNFPQQYTHILVARRTEKREAGFRVLFLETGAAAKSRLQQRRRLGFEIHFSHLISIS